MFNFVCDKREFSFGEVGYTARLESDDVVYRVAFMPSQYIVVAVVGSLNQVIATSAQYHHIDTIKPYKNLPTNHS